MESNPAIEKKAFKDFDAYTESVENADIRFTLTRLETPLWIKTSVSLPGDIHIQVAAEGSGDIAQGCTPGDGYHLLLVTDRHQFTANGYPLPSGSALFLPPASEFLLPFLEPHQWMTVFVPTATMESVVLGGGNAHPCGQGTRAIRDREDNTRRLARLTERFIQRATAAPKWVMGTQSVTRFRREFLDELKGICSPALPVPAPERGRATKINRAVIANVVDYIESSHDAVKTIRELAQVTGLPERSLRAGFMRYVGVSPKRYLQLCLLNRARKRLMESEPGEVTVTQVATELSFWDLGRFAMRYRNAFAELPSDTLRG